MKRFAALGAALLGAMLLLTACAPQENSVSDEPLLVQHTEAARSALPFAVGRLYDLAWTDYYSSLSGINDGKAFYTLEQSSMMEDADGKDKRVWLILRIDYETGIQSPLCSLSNCTHETEGCPAYLCGEMGNDSFELTVVEGQLYVLHRFENETSEQALQPTVWLDRAALDGSGRRRVAEFPAGWMMLAENFPVTDGAALYGRYYDLSDRSIHGVRVALETGEIATFSYGLDDCEELYGALEGQFIMRRADHDMLQSAYPSVMAIERNGVTMNTLGSYFARSIVLYDPAAGTRTDRTELIAQIEAQKTGYYSFLQQGKLYYIFVGGMDDLQSAEQVDLAAGTHRVLAEFAPPAAEGSSFRSLEHLQLFPAGPDTQEPYVLGSYWDDYSHYFLLDVRDGSVVELGLQRTVYSGRGDGSFPVAQTDSGLWLAPINYEVDAWGNQHWDYGLAAPETVISGEGEVYPVQMWAPSEPLG